VKSPWWRDASTSYYSADPNQRYYFLAAFARTKAEKVACGIATDSSGAANKFLYQPVKSPSAAYAVLGKLSAGLTDEQLVQLAERLCDDDVLEQLYPEFLKNDGTVDKLSSALLEPPHLLLEKVVGLDWVGDELGFPYCIFSHHKVVDLVRNGRTKNPAFGLRLHAGEGVMRPSSGEMESGVFHNAFKLHVRVDGERAPLCCKPGTH
jgi:hypothetical protein